MSCQADSAFHIEEGSKSQDLGLAAMTTYDLPNLWNT